MPTCSFSSLREAHQAVDLASKVGSVIASAAASPSESSMFETASRCLLEVSSSVTGSAAATSGHRSCRHLPLQRPAVRSRTLWHQEPPAQDFRRRPDVRSGGAQMAELRQGDTTPWATSRRSQRTPATTRTAACGCPLSRCSEVRGATPQHRSPGGPWRVAAAAPRPAPRPSCGCSRSSSPSISPPRLVAAILTVCMLQMSAQALAWMPGWEWPSPASA
mmetsp:Transcript_150395/g.265419  ORF Transcript_150395/g.265419 Transcript_150395/m.265419 type:complete len:219 (-) Transcript_150395:139-795(-)